MIARLTRYRYLATAAALAVVAVAAAVAVLLNVDSESPAAPEFTVTAVISDWSEGKMSGSCETLIRSRVADDDLSESTVRHAPVAITGFCLIGITHDEIQYLDATALLQARARPEQSRQSSTQ